MVALRDLFLALPEDLQRLVLDKVSSSYSLWVKNRTLFVDTTSFGDYADEGDLQSLQLSTSLGWIERLVIVPVDEVRSRFWGGEVYWYKPSRFDVVSLVLYNRGPVPYFFDEEYRHQIEPEREAKPSLQEPEPYTTWPYKYLPCWTHWNPQPGYNPLDHKTPLFFGSWG